MIRSSFYVLAPFSFFFFDVTPLSGVVAEFPSSPRFHTGHLSFFFFSLPLSRANFSGTFLKGMQKFRTLHPMISSLAPSTPLCTKLHTRFFFFPANPPPSPDPPYLKSSPSPTAITCPFPVFFLYLFTHNFVFLLESTKPPGPFRTPLMPPRKTLTLHVLRVVLSFPGLSRNLLRRFFF